MYSEESVMSIPTKACWLWKLFLLPAAVFWALHRAAGFMLFVQRTRFKNGVWLPVSKKCTVYLQFFSLIYKHESYFKIFLIYVASHIKTVLQI